MDRDRMDNEEGIKAVINLENLLCASVKLADVTTDVNLNLTSCRHV